MNYKLALELKKAGFPQGDISSLPQERYWIKEEVCYIPTLSELIEACGDDFQLTKWDLNSNWIASTEIYYDDAGYQDDIGKGKTPEEAVAKLYIKLNKKDE